MPIDELVAFSEFMREGRSRSVDNDRLLGVAKLIDPAAFLPSRRDDENMSASDALGKARRIMEFLGE